MGRKKIDKTTIEYISKNLFHKDGLIGFQFTAGRTPRAIYENEPFSLHLSLNFDESKGGVVIDCSETTLKHKIMLEFFPKYPQYGILAINPKGIENLTKLFNELGYQTENAETVGEWYWFRVRCKNDEIMGHVNILKEALKDFDLTPS